MPSTDSVICPECHTRFRVDAEQLALANGLLRCGVCQHVFNALGDNPASDTTTEMRGAEEPGDEVQSDHNQPTESEPAPLDAHHSDSETPTAPDDGTDSEPPAKNKADVLLEGLSTVGHDFEHHQHHGRERRWPWLLLNLVAVLVLAGQVAYWQRSALLASPARDTVLIACDWLSLPCQAQPGSALSSTGPAPSAEPSQVSTSKLLVRKHPQQAQALIVDTILINRSEQTVTFPPLLLRFSDINGREVASRIFRPKDYLHGELNALSELAPQQPVHIALEIADPGAAAVNYELEVLAAN